MNKQLKAYSFLVMAMSIAGSAVVAGKLIISDVPIFLAAELGILFSLPFLFFPALRQGKSMWPSDSRTHMILLAQAVFGVVLYRIFMFWGLKYTSATAAGLVGSTAPVLIVILAVFVLCEKLSVPRIVGALCVSIGISVMNILPFLDDSTEAANAFMGNSLVMIAVFCEALFSVMSKSRCQPMSALLRAAIVSLYAFLCLLPLALYDACHYDFAQITTPSLLCLAYYGFFVSFLSYVFWFKGVASVPAGIAGLFTGFVPLSSVFFSRLILGEEITQAHWIGLFFVLTGIVYPCVPKHFLKYNPLKCIRKKYSCSSRLTLKWSIFKR